MGWDSISCLCCGGGCGHECEKGFLDRLCYWWTALNHPKFWPPNLHRLFFGRVGWWLK